MSEENDKKIPLKEYWALLGQYMRPQAAWVALLAALLFGGIGMQLLSPQIMRRFIDSAADESIPLATVMTTALLFVGTALAQQVLNVLSTYLGERVGMVTQNVQLFRGSVRDNLTFFAAHDDDQHIEQVLFDMGLENWFKRLPDGLDTLLESDGGGLSAGEAQLLTFARVFLRDPQLVLLDEATSRLDPATEGVIERAIDKLLENRTAIIIAHRLSTVQRADDILILEEGRVREYGPRMALAANSDSHFSHLLKTGLTEVLQ